MKNLRFTLRMLKRSPLLVFVNLPGLAIGLSVVLLLTLYVNHELSYDQHFPTKDRTIRIYNKFGQNDQFKYWGICLREAYTQIPPKIPEIKAASQIYRGWEVNASNGINSFNQQDLLYADPGFFEVFGLNLIEGDKNIALEGEKKVVVTKSTAERIFNQTDCMGRMVYISDEPFTITGVIEDLPKNTHFDFDLLASIQTIRPERYSGLEFYTYFLLDEKANVEATGKKIAMINDELMIPWAKPLDIKTETGIELLSQLHLKSKIDFDLSPKANISSILLIAGIAFFILLIALVNYINLYVLHGEKRIGEIASRKSLGASPWKLARLFYFETGVIGLTAFAIAIVIALLVLPLFENLMQHPLEISDLLSPSGIAIILGFLVLLILISGAYPSFYLSRINLVNALKGAGNQVNRKSKLSTVSVIVQFTVTVFLISALVIIYSQTKFLKDLPLGFTPQQVIGISGFDSEIKGSYRSVQEELRQLSFVETIGASHHHMGGGCSGQGIRIYGNPGKYESINQYRVQPGFCQTMKLRLVDGQYFQQRESDKNAVILNEAAVKMLELSNPIGKLVQMHLEPLRVIGVVKDFYYNDHPGEPIAPLAITAYSDEVSAFYLRVSGDPTTAQKQQIASVMRQYDPDYVFSSFLLTDIYKNKFDEDERVLKLVSSGTLLAILISFIGLMALSIMNVTRRTKEIGIRKVMGSSETELVGKLMQETIILVGISICIAFVAEYFAMHHWLNSFANKIDLHPGYFLLSGIFALMIAIIAVAWQSWKAATKNPVEALRYE